MANLGFQTSIALDRSAQSPEDGEEFWLPRKLHKSLLEGRRRDALVGSCATRLRDWQWSAWEREADEVLRLRVRFIYEGFGWHEADAEAAEIVRLAFLKLGKGARPTWAEGQPESLIPRENCQRCAAPLTREQLAAGMMFCDDGCEASARAFRAEWFARLEATARSNSHYHEHKRSETTATCPGCGSEFHPLVRGQKFCSISCGSKAKAYLQERACDTCGTTFQPTHTGHRFCSHACRGEGMKGKEYPERECGECGTPFRPKHPRGQFCSSSCNYRHQNRKRRERREQARAS